MLVDHAKITIQSGNGGNGCISFRREKYVPFGGPDGGDGGKGGNVVFQANEGLITLLDVQKKHFYKAQNGVHGKGSNCYGKNGEDCLILAPVGTQIFDAETNELLGDLIHQNQQIIVAYGGVGGRGNSHFATSTNQAPRIADEGKPGEKRTLNLELKLIAQVGLIGFPNVGKSTLLSKISKAKPKIADYPFTTLYPNLGMTKLDEETSIITADIPGLVKDAHKGIGLGHRFLRHIERTEILIHILDISADPISQYNTLNEELKLYNEELLKKKQIIVVNKMDIQGSVEKFKKVVIPYFASLGIQPVPISGLTGEGIDELLKVLGQIAPG
ncbi:MAG: GTPase ObgE [bacterium]|nr:GTPase ObgE [bacterium]